MRKSFKIICPRYIKAKQRKVSIARDIAILERFKKRFGRKGLDQLTRADVEDYRDDRAEDRTAAGDQGEKRRDPGFD